MNETGISWTDLTWNPWSGCKQISPGCAHCYALTHAERFRGTTAFPHGFELTYRWHKLDEPLRTNKPSKIFVNSMSDLYLEDVPLEAIQRVFDVMNRASHHQFQVLTKRSQRLKEIAGSLTWTDNIWQGVSVENQHWTSRINDLVESPAKIKFVSAEPLLEKIDLSPWLDYIDWVIVGGESGPHFRPMETDWARSIRDQCRNANVAFFFKQASGRHPGTNPVLDGMLHQEFPSISKKIA